MISIIIPTYNEEKIISSTLRQINNLKGDFEIIVSDGGSSDSTIDIASKYVKVIESEKGRSRQLNQGVKKARGDILLFLHADAKLPSDFFNKIEDVIKKGYIGGRFRLKFDKSNLSLRLATFLAGYDFFRLYYGDQGFFCKRSVFDKLQGYRNLDIMEDIDFYRRMKKLGKLKVIKETIVGSSRRFYQNGVIKTLILMSMLKFLYAIRVSDRKLKQLYLDIR